MAKTKDQELIDEVVRSYEGSIGRHPDQEPIPENDEEPVDKVPTAANKELDAIMKLI